jgi:ribosome-associated protein
LEEIRIDTDFIKLEQFLKFAGAALTGGQAKNMVISGAVSVNGEICYERGKKLFGGEIITARAGKAEKEVFKVIKDDIKKDIR